MLIPSADPTIVPPSSGGVYDQWFITNLNVMAVGGPNGPLRTSATLTKVNGPDPSGYYEVSPVDPPVVYYAFNLWDVAAERPAIVALFTQINNLLEALAIEDGLLPMPSGYVPPSGAWAGSGV